MNFELKSLTLAQAAAIPCDALVVLWPDQPSASQGGGALAELIVREAGGMVCDFAGGNNHMKSGNIVAASPKVLQAMVKGMRPHLSETLAK